MKYKVTHDGIIKTYAVLWHTAWHLLETAKEQQDGRLLNLQAASVFYAFAFEAYLNHVGLEETLFRDEVERISRARKLRLIGTHLHVTFDTGAKPFETIDTLFKLRDTLAHGHTMPITTFYETDSEPDHMASWRLLEWETLTIEKVDGYSGSVKEAVEIINHARAHPDSELWNEGIRGRLVQLIKEECEPPA